jgi:hypothetical protein
MLLQRPHVILLLAITLGIGCNSQQSVAPGVGVDATVRFAHSVEASCWSLATTSTVYQPVDLPSAFQIEGLSVHVVLRDAPDWISICSVGPLVHVASIQAR